MRVAFFVNSFPLVSEVFIMNLAAALVDLGHDLDIYALAGPGQPDVLNAAGRASGLLDRTHSPRHARSSSFRRWMAMPATALAVGRTQGIRVAASAFDAANHRRRTVGMRALDELAMFNGHAPPDVLHCHFGSLGEQLRRHLRTGGLDAALVTHFRGYDLGPYVERHGPSCYDRLFRQGDAFIANSKFFRQRAIRLGCAPKSIRVVESPVDVSNFNFRLPSDPAGREVRLLTVGRLVEKKGIAYAIEAVAALRERGHILSYRIVGEGGERAALEALISRLGLSDCVTLLGSQPHSVVAAELAHTDIFLAPSVTALNGDADAAINTLKEAMLCGVPLVSTRHGGIPELVEHENTGLLVPERDAVALADAVEALLLHPERWGPMASRARCVADRRFGLVHIAKQTLEVYETAIANRRSRRAESSYAMPLIPSAGVLE